METIFFGNGINRLVEGFPSWNTLLNKLAGEKNIRPNATNNIIEYEGILANQYSSFLSKKLSALEGEKYDNELEKKMKERMRDIMLNADRDGKCSRHRIYQLLANLKPSHYISTNYDNYLLNTFLSLDYNVENAESPRTQEKIYSIRRHYVITKENESLISYWPIHGEIKNVRSMMFGLDHYCGSIGKIGNYLKGGYKDEEEGFLARLRKAKDLQNISIHSWVDLFFISNIHIVGFSFGYDEIDLWWILNRRYRLFMQDNNLITNKIIFYGNPTLPGQSELFKAFGVEIKPLDYCPLYEESFSKILSNHLDDKKNFTTQNQDIPSQFTFNEYRQLYNISNIATKRAIAKLLNDGIIEAIGSRRFRYYIRK